MAELDEPPTLDARTEDHHGVRKIRVLSLDGAPCLLAGANDFARHRIGHLGGLAALFDVADRPGRASIEWRLEKHLALDQIAVPLDPRPHLVGCQSEGQSVLDAVED